MKNPSKQQKMQQADVLNIKPWQVAKNKIADFTTNIWTKKWENDPQYKHTKLLYAAPNKNKSKYVMNMGTSKLGTWIKGITGHNNLAIFNRGFTQKLTPHGDYAS